MRTVLVLEVDLKGVLCIEKRKTVFVHLVNLFS